MEFAATPGSVFHGDNGCGKEMHNGGRLQETHQDRTVVMKTSSNFAPCTRRFIAFFKAVEVRTRVPIVLTGFYTKVYTGNVR